MSNIYEGLLFDKQYYWSERIKGYVGVYRILKGNKPIVVAEDSTKADMALDKYRATGVPQIAPGLMESKPTTEEGDTSGCQSSQPLSANT